MQDYSLSVLTLIHPNIPPWENWLCRIVYLASAGAHVRSGLNLVSNASYTLPLFLRFQAYCCLATNDVRG